MIRIRLAFVAVVAALALVSSAAAQASTTPLVATVGPGFTISLTPLGKKLKVAKLKAGTYTIKVSDKSSIHNFHLTGPGVKKTTSVSGTGSATWVVKLVKGTYKYVCDPHASIMKGSFIVS